MQSKKIFPKKLSKGDEIRVISPARSMGIVPSSVRSLALSRLKEMGLKVSFSKHCEERDMFDSSSVESRLEDIHEAFADENVNAILTTIGGYNLDFVQFFDSSSERSCLQLNEFLRKGVFHPSEEIHLAAVCFSLEYSSKNCTKSR